ncbi:hypothetical protein [Brevibacterium sp. Mu109]|uniref:hypothetical protein n=1 Tax=Brevibacterium sp. Mu109 TaxID=1255669 RepID=UPI0011AF367F|nr:hypothetical protein [Brevibacterium sp. Mu109]
MVKDPRPPNVLGSRLQETVALLDTIEPTMNAVRLGIPSTQGTWDLCTSVIKDQRYVRRWQDAVSEELARIYSTPASRVGVTAAACVLDWYAYAPGFLVGAMFHIARRVPNVAPEVVAFRRNPVEHWISGTALCDNRFWCLPDDPAADDKEAHVVGDEVALAAIARAQVRNHADRFLASYDPGVRLPRRALTGVFFDSLDSGPWIAEPLAPGVSCIDSSRLLLPGRADHFTDQSKLYELTDLKGRSHISRRRVACCESYRIEPDGAGCFDCPRTSDNRRTELATNFPD